jgi:hypothetical protein
MKADTIDLNRLFFAGVRCEVPRFQRPYVWTETEQWEPLWEDISTTAERLRQERERSTPKEREEGITERNTPPKLFSKLTENDEILRKAADDRFKVWPTNADPKILFRLSEADAAGLEPVELSKVGDYSNYRMRASLSTEERYAVCLELASQSYIRAIA